MITDNWDLSDGSCNSVSGCTAKTSSRKRPRAPSSQTMEVWFAGKGKSSVGLAGRVTTTITCSETTCSAAAKGNWNCTALPVSTPLYGLQLTIPERDFSSDQLREGRIFSFQTEGLDEITNATTTTARAAETSSMLDSSALENKSLMKQHINVFFLFTNILQITFLL